MSKRLFTSVFFLVLLAFMAGRSYACPILKAVISPSKPKWVHQEHELSFEGCTSVGSIAQCTWTLPGTYGDPNYSQHIYPNDHVRCRFGAPGAYTIILKVRDNQGRESTDTCTVYVVSIGIVIAPGESSYVAVNNDDDNENGIMDMCEGGQVSGENDLCKVLLSVSTPKITDTVSLGALPVGEPQMRVWGYPDRRSLLISTGDSIDTVEWPSGSVPTEVYVEASSYAAGFINSKYLRLYYTGVDCNTIPPTKYIVDRVPQAEIYFTFVEVDMDMAGVKDNYYETLQVTEEMVPGGFIALNDDDDNNNETPDKDEGGVVAGEDDLVKITLMKVVPTDIQGVVTLNALAGGSKIKVWESATKGTLVTLPKIYATPTELPKELWVEGVETSSTARDITLALQCGGFDDRIKATIVKGDKIQYSDPVSGYTDISGTLYVNTGTTVTFKAIPNPSGASWPTDRPIWGGSSGASGTSETTAVTFNTLSSTLSDYKTVTATCGNTITVNVIVYDFQGILCPQDDFDGRSQSCYGIAEKVDLDCDITPSGLTASQIGGLQWELLDGVGELSSVTEAGTAVYDAGASAGDVTFVLVVMSGPSMGAGFFNPYDRTVVEPSGAYMIQKPGTGIWHIQNTASVGFKGYIYLNPKNVSFENIKFREDTCTATASGFYAYQNGLIHPQGSWCFVGSGDISTGCRVLATDTVEAEPKGPPYSIGDFNWPIPWQWLCAGISSTFQTVNQHKFADNLGKCSYEKAGAGPFPKNAADPNSGYFE